jgi:hypothetical protein
LPKERLHGGDSDWHAVIGRDGGTKTRVSKHAFGKDSEGKAVDLYTLSDGAVEARIMTFGGIVVSINVPDRSGKLRDVITRKLRPVKWAVL